MFIFCRRCCKNNDSTRISLKNFLSDDDDDVFIHEILEGVWIAWIVWIVWVVWVVWVVWIVWGKYSTGEVRGLLGIEVGNSDMLPEIKLF